jgi:hypothetical protein
MPTVRLSDVYLSCSRKKPTSRPPPCLLLFVPSETAHTWFVGDLSSVVVLTPIRQSGYWRVKMAWPNNNIHYFGRFLSQQEAEKWIEKHSWLTKQSQELKKIKLESP